MSIPTLRAHQVHTLEDRVRILKDLVWKGDQVANPKGPPTGSLRDPQMRQYGLLVTKNCPPRADMCELEAIFNTLAGWRGQRAQVRYTGDIAGKDTYQSALRTLQYGGGDCDDAAVLNAVLAMENGFSCKFRITSNTGSSWDHIYCMAGVTKHNPTKWIALDTTLGAGKFGVEPGRAKYRDFLVGGV